MRMVPLWYRSGFGMAAAAVVVLAFGFAYRPFSAVPASASSVGLTPNKYTESLVAMHDRCCGSSGRHQVSEAPASCVIATGHALEKRLGLPVLAASIPEGGWTFHGGAVCAVLDENRKRIPAAHLIFKQGNESVSVVSLPRSAAPCRKANQGQYQGEYNKHAIAGFVDSRGSYSLVGSGSDRITPQRLAAMRDRIQASVIASPLPTEYRPTVVRAELLETTP